MSDTKTVSVLDIAKILGLAKRGPPSLEVGPCWSCDAVGSMGFACRVGHQWNACGTECGHPRLDADGFAIWDDCHECQTEVEEAMRKGPCGHGVFIQGCDSCGDRYDAESGE